MFKLLLADDDKLFLESVAATIEGELENIETTMAFDGMDALVKFDEIRPDIVITDHDMPHRNGTDVLNGILKNGHTTPVILLTGNANSVDVNLFSDVLEKPFRISDLVEVVKKHLPST